MLVPNENGHYTVWSFCPAPLASSVSPFAAPAVCVPSPNLRPSSAPSQPLSASIPALLCLLFLFLPPHALRLHHSSLVLLLPPRLCLILLRSHFLFCQSPLLLNTSTPPHGTINICNTHRLPHSDRSTCHSLSFSLSLSHSLSLSLSLTHTHAHSSLLAPCLQ